MNSQKTFRFPLPILLAATMLINTAHAQTATPNPAPALVLHVPSPDWRDQIIYFLLTDRFNDGDKTNNDQGANEYDPTSGAKYSGGDLRGITQRLDYIKGLGATAVWITPPVANQWWDPLTNYSGYHGYWAENFKQVDKHVGTLDDYQQLSHQLHSRGMYLVQDIVLNHTGNFFQYTGAFNPRDVSKNFALNSDSRPMQAPSQVPFNLNDAQNPTHRKAGIYHWTPNINNFQVPQQVLNYQMSGLDDLNTENPVVRAALRDSYGYWIREVGVDAFRVDTAIYVPTDFLRDFMTSREPKNPGIAAVAKATGRNQFHVFGEGFGIDQPFADTEAKKAERYMREANGAPVLPGMLNFGLYGALTDVFARGRPTAELAHRITRNMQLHRRAHWMPTFVDNHDLDRFLATGNVAALKQSLLALMTLPGIPVIYYGTEQAFTEQRGAMFAAGFASGGKDRFDTNAPLYQFIQRVTALRQSDKIFSRGTPTMLKSNAAAAGALAYRMSYEGATAIIAFNSAEHDTLLDNVQTNLPAGTVLRGVFGIEQNPADVTVGARGLVTLKLVARSGSVWKVTAQRGVSGIDAKPISISAMRSNKVSGDFKLTGSAPSAAPFKLVVDGDVSAAETVTPEKDGHWSVTVDTAKFIDGKVRHQAVAWSEADGATSTSVEFFVAREWKLVADVPDPKGDDTGPGGKYQYPLDVSWSANRQADIYRTRVFTSGGAMKIEVTMNSITKAWNPPNGFDHVAFSIFIELANAGEGATVMPLQNASVPAGMTWHRHLRAHGWSNALFASSGATANSEGALVSPAADINVDAQRKTVTFVLAAAALANAKSLSGAKVYVTTWDYDGGYRPLTPTVQNFSFGGAEVGAALVMDETEVITAP